MKQFTFLFAPLALLFIQCGRGPNLVREEPFSWAPVVEEVQDASYALGLRNGSGEFILVGSGVAVRPDVILTNAHVAQGLFQEYIAMWQAGINVEAIAVANGSSTSHALVFPLDRVAIHSDYAEDSVFTADLAVFYLEGEAPTIIEIGESKELARLRVGDPIATLGYPGETRGIWSNRVVATFKSGVISALGGFSMVEQAAPEQAYIIQHDFNTTPGTSGSPIFTRNGQLVAVNNAELVKMVWDDASGDFLFLPVGSIGYSVRADLALTLLEGTRAVPETLSSLYIPDRLAFSATHGLVSSKGGAGILPGSSTERARVISDSLFGKSAPYSETPEGFTYSDGVSYRASFLIAPGSDRVGWIRLSKPKSGRYRPAFKDDWNVTVGTSRSYILGTYGSDFTIQHSPDGSTVLYAYPRLGLAFGFDVSEGNWFCDEIYLGEPGLDWAKAVDLLMIPAPGPITIPASVR